MNAASPGDTIYVRAGTYHETVTINKNNLALTGENKFTTIIDGSGGTDRTFLVNKADNVQISGFTIQNSYDGIFLLESSFSTVSGNIITTCSFRGVILSCSSFVSVSGNTLTSNNDGVELYRSSFVTVSGNTITNSRFGIGTSQSFNNTFSGNTITTCQQGIYMWDCSYTTVSGNTISNTTEHGISLVVSAYCSFFANTITSSAMRGISIGNSTDCVVSGNTVKYCANQGIHTFCSSGHTISDNTLTSNFVGLGFYMCSDSTVFGNTMSQGRTGITVTQASNNIFYHNSIVDNQYQVVAQNSINTWDDGYPSGGNYWSDYKGTDADGNGIGDSPYVIDENNQDNYPLMTPYGSNIPISYTLVVESVPSGVTFTADNITCVAPWSETYNQTTFVTLTMPESYFYEEKNFTWARWDNGNTNKTRTVTVDKYTELIAIFTTEYEPPKIVVLSPENKTYSVTDVPLEYTVNTPFYVTTYSLNGQENVTIVGNTTLTGLSEGPHSVVLYIEEVLGNITASDTIYFTVNATVPDTTPPTVSVLSPVNTTYTSNQVPLNFTVNEQTDWIGYSIDEQENVTVTGNTTLTELTNGLHTIVVYANDTSGNSAHSNTTYFTVALPILGVTILAPQNTTYNTLDVLFGYLVNETCSNVTYSLDGQPFVDAENVTVLSGLADGSHELTVNANFTDNDFGEEATVWFIVDTVPPTIAEVTVLPLTVNGTLEDGANVNATITDAVSGLNHVVLRYTTDNETWVTTQMAQLEGEIWNGTLPEFAHATNVTYIVVAEDIAGNIITSEELFGQPNQYQVLPEFTSWIILSMLLSIVVLGRVYRKKLHKTPNQQSY